MGADCCSCACRAPDALYENGLQRHLFLPFIARLKQETTVHDINSTVDYRRLAQHRRGLFYTAHDFQDPGAEVEAQFRALAEACHEPSGPTEVRVMMGRKLPVPQACERCSLRGSTPALLNATQKAWRCCFGARRLPAEAHLLVLLQCMIFAN